MDVLRRTGRGVTAAALAVSLAPAGVLRAQPPLVPLIAPPAVHFPAQPPPPGTGAVSDYRALVRSSAPFLARPSVPTAGPVWSSPGSVSHALASLFPSALMPATLTLSSIGPTQILGGQAPGSGAVSGRITAIAVDPVDANTFYIAGAGGGVWKTINGGSSFTVLTDDLPDIAMGALAVDPSNSNIIYAGSGEASFSGDSRYGAGVYKSTNGGASWTQYTGPGGAFLGNSISRIVVDPTNSNNVYLGTAFAGDNGHYGGWGVYKSVNGGQTWAYAFSPDSASQISNCTDLAIDRFNPQTLYAAIAYIGGNGYNTLNGIWKTTNGGTSWTLLSAFPNGATNSAVGRIALTLSSSSATASTLYANYCSGGTNFGTLQGTYRSTDGGASFTKLTTPDYLGQQGWYDDTIAASPSNPNIVYAAGQVNYNAGSTNGIIGSQDGGATWADYSFGTNGQGPHTDHHAFAFTNGGRLLNGNDGGLWQLSDPTTTTSKIWTDLNTNLTITQFTGIGIHPTDATIAYGGSQDNGTEKYTGSSVWNQVRGGDGGFTRVDQTTPTTVYHEYYQISLERSDNSGATWNGKSSGISEADPTLDGSDPSAFYVPFVLDPLNQSRVYYGTNNVYLSVNRGDQFVKIGIPGTNGFNPGTSTNTISTLAAAGGTVYAAEGGTLYVTTNALSGTAANTAATWAARTVPNVGSVGAIYVDPATPLTAIVTNGNFNNGHVLRTTNGGANWTDISGSLPNQPYHAVNRDPATNTLYVGGDDGVYVSYDTGGTWTKANMPNAQVVDISVSPGAGIVAAGTHGRGLFEAPLPPYVSTVTLTSSRNPSLYGQSVILSAFVTGNGTRTGTVSFFDSGAFLGQATLDASSTATLTVSGLTPGPHSLTASYSGDTLSATAVGAYNQSVNPVTVSGKVSLQNVASGSLAQSLTFTFTPTGTTTGGVTTQTLTPAAADGSFTLASIPAGTYTLGVKGAKWLRKDVPVDTTGGSVTVPTIPLLGGDLDGNNQVDINDFLILRAGFNAVGPNLPADIDCNGQVDINDFLILRANFNSVGQP